MNLAALLGHAGAAHAGRPALTVGDAVWADYGTFARRAAAVAGGLRARLGLAPGDRVALVMRNRPEYLEALFAIWHAGLVAVPVNAKLHRDEFAWILDHSGARLCLTSPDLHASVESIPSGVAGLERVLCVDDEAWSGLRAGEPAPLADAAPSDPAWLFYTSGTTGRPKGAVLSHRSLLAMTLAYYADIGAVAPGDTMIHPAPLSHGSGLYAISHVARAANNVIPASGHFEPREIFELVAAHPAVSFFAAPTMVTRLLNDRSAAGADVGNLECVVYGGGPMYVADLKRALAGWGPRLAQIYGQGESPMTITALDRAHHAASDHPRFDEWLASTGFPRTGVEVRVLGDDDRPLPPGEIGEVAVRGDVLMSGYWRDADASAAALRGGWLHTGDLGALDPEGFLTLKDRSRDLIISGGANIYPREVEEVLLRHAGVAECAVIGAPHPEWGEEVVAFVVARPRAAPSADDLDALCLAHIARFKRPRRYRFVDALPKNNYGKVPKTELRRLLAEGGA